MFCSTYLYLQLHSTRIWVRTFSQQITLNADRNLYISQKKYTYRFILKGRKHIDS